MCDQLRVARRVAQNSGSHLDSSFGEALVCPDERNWALLRIYTAALHMHEVTAAAWERGPYRHARTHVWLPLWREEEEFFNHWLPLWQRQEALRRTLRQQLHPETLHLPKI